MLCPKNLLLKSKKHFVLQKVAKNLVVSKKSSTFAPFKV